MKSLFATLALLFLTSSAYPEIISTQLNTAPNGIQYKGKLVDLKEVTDAGGKHVIVLSKVEHKAIGEAGYQSEIYASKYTYMNGAYKKQWEVKELNPTDLVSLNFLGRLEVADIDKDGTAETLFMYEIAPDGLDPVTVKLMLHYKNKKYAIRGEIPQQDSEKPRRRIDASFDLLPASVKTYAKQYWDREAKN